MKHFCKNCGKEYEGRLNKLYCSVKCRERQKHLRQKDTEKFKVARRKRDKRYYYKHHSQRITRLKNISFRKYQNEWRVKNKYHLKLYNDNPEKSRERSIRYNKTDKGKLNKLKCNERRRRKLLSIKDNGLNTEELNFITNRDKVCAYCGKEFNDNIKCDKRTFDHFNCNAPLGRYNTVCCCWSCNSSKRNIPVYKITEWIDRKKFKNVSQIVYLLLMIHTNSLAEKINNSIFKK